MAQVGLKLFNLVQHCNYLTIAGSVLGISHQLQCVSVLYTTGVQSDSDSSAVSNKMNTQSMVKPNRPSLAKILLSLDGNLAKQQALSHVLSALQIIYARYVFPMFGNVRSRCLEMSTKRHRPTTLILRRTLSFFVIHLHAASTVLMSPMYQFASLSM